MCYKNMIAGLAVALCLSSFSWSAPMGTAFEYRGKLNTSGSPANGLHNFQFNLYDAGSGGTGIGTPNVLNHVNVSNGMFTVRLDFGALAGTFNGEARWLQIAVQTNGGSVFTTLSPRQPAPLTPYALYAVKAGGVDISPWDMHVGSLTDGQSQVHSNLLMFSIGPNWQVLFEPGGGIHAPNFDLDTNGDLYSYGGGSFDNTLSALGGIEGPDGGLTIWGGGIRGDGNVLAVRGDLEVNGGLNITGTLNVDGDLNVKGIKNFVQPHPGDPFKEIVYTCLEGPEAGTYVRGSASLTNGEAIIELPEHFRMVTGVNGVTAQVTPRGEWLQLYVVTADARRLVVRDAQGKNGQFDYLVQGVRKGYENQQVIRERQQSGGKP